jgi:lysophospholipase L1-like esterase
VRWLISAVAVITLLLTAFVAVPALRASAAGDPDREQDYLALGDSVAFGFSPLLDFHREANFIGYPSPVATALDEHLTNAACPGEATGGFISLTGTDNGCRPYRANFPLHTGYSTDQLDYAVQFIESHPHTRLISIDIGANDLFVLQRQCAGSISCVQAHLPGLLATVSANLDTIYGAIRNTAKYTHQLVALTYYSLNYADQVTTTVIAQLNAVIISRTLAWGGIIADGFGAFAVASASHNGDTCAAGLRIVLPPSLGGGCDVHPTVAGRNVLAAAVLAVVRHNNGQGDANH